MFGYIYFTTNLINGKKYIGQKQSEFFVENYKGSGVYIRKDIKKYGLDKFETKILEWCEDRESLNERESYWIEYYDAVNDDGFYNFASGGQGFNKGSKFSEEHKKAISNAVSGEKNHNYGRKLNENQEKSLERGRHAPASEKLKKRLSEIRTGCDVSKETRDKLAKAALGKICVNDGKINKMIYPSQLTEYLSKGFSRGQKPRAKKST